MDWPIQEEIIFHDDPYLVSMKLIDNEKFVLEVQANSTADQWRAEFDKVYIEELTHKTGNFKQFDIFVNMLENAITDSSESVSLELLTYSDLEALRSHKSGNTSSNGYGKKSELSSKRYLILIYSVEFDRIHYPLPLPYVGKPDPVALQNEIRDLKQKLAETDSSKRNTQDDKQKIVLRHLKEEISALKQEKEEILYEFDLFKKEVKESSNSSIVAKEIKVLKGVIKNLEAELLREKSKHQKLTNKLNQEYNQLLDEIEESKSNERSLRSRVKNLTAELTILKKGSSHTNGFNKPQRIDSPKLSPRIPKNPKSTHHSSSQANYIINNSSTLQQSEKTVRAGDTNSRGRQRNRTNSIEDLSIGVAVNGRSRCRERGGTGSNFSNRSRSPSGSVSSRNRFDPTSYIKEKAQKAKENQLRRSLDKLPQNRRRRSSENVAQSSQRGRSSSFDQNRIAAASQLRRGRNDLTSGDESDASSVGSRRSQNSGTGRIFVKKNTLNSSNGSIRSSNGSLRKDRAAPNRGHIAHISPRDISAAAVNRSLHGSESSNPTRMDALNQSTDLEDIDARLNALQEFMKLNL